MRSLLHQRCFHHAAREAVARCPECTRFYCRECVTEHEGRIICANCLRRLAEANAAVGAGWWQVARGVMWMLSFGLAWSVFYGLGSMLLAIDPKVHDELLNRLVPSFMR